MEKRIPFDIKYRPEIEAGKYLVVTRDDRPVRVICWDRKGAYPIVGLIKDGRREVVDMFDTDGAYERGEEHRFDLYLVANPDYKEPKTESELTPSEPSEAAVLATMSALKAEFTNYEHSYQCRVKMRANLGTTEVWGQGETPYKAAIEVYKQLIEEKE